jgi:hypothetical protein
MKWGQAVTAKNLLSAFSRGRFDLSPADAKKIVADIKDGIAWNSQGSMASGSLEKASSMIGGFGVEAISGKDVNRYWMDTVALYINTGDTYNPTILFDTVARKFGITSVGDFVEVMGDEYGIR